MKILVPVFMALSIGAQAQSIHFKSVVVDTHNDAVTACIEKKVSLDQDLRGINHSDLKRFKEGGLDYQLFSIWCDGDKKNPYAWAMREMDTLDAVAARNPDKMVVAKNWSQIQKALKESKLKVQASIQGDAVRVTGAKRDDLQAAMALLRKDITDIPISFNNFRD